MKARRCAYIFPRKRQWLLLPFFFVRGKETSFKRLILMCIRHRPLLHIFSTESDETPSKKCRIMMPCCHVFFEWPLNAVLHKKLSLQLFCRKNCTIKDGTQTYDFIVDKSCLLFLIKNTGEMYKII